MKSNLLHSEGNPLVSSWLELHLGFCCWFTASPSVSHLSSREEIINLSELLLTQDSVSAVETHAGTWMHRCNMCTIYVPCTPTCKHIINTCSWCPFHSYDFWFLCLCQCLSWCNRCFIKYCMIIKHFVIVSVCVYVLVCLQVISWCCVH